MALLLTFLFAGTAAADTPAASNYAGGNGTQGNPFQISTLAELRKFMESAPFFGNGVGYFKLTATIDAADTSTWLSGAGWKPADVSILNGAFDGQNFEIQNLYVNRPAEDSVGFFKSTSVCCQDLKNLRIIGGQITGRDNVGGLIGATGNSTTITNSHSTATISGRQSVGGLIGYAGTGTTSGSSAGGAVTGTGILVGGLVGQATGPTSSTHATGHVTGKGQVGGLIGAYTPLTPPTAVTSSWASGQVDGDEMVGGLVGRSTGKVAFSFASGAVTATGVNPTLAGYVFAGGLIGQQGANAATEDCYASGAVTGPLKAIGGLIGANLGPIARCATVATQTVAGTTGAGSVGGLVGDNQGSITLSRAASMVNASNAVEAVGGLVGIHTGGSLTITTSYATGNVTGTGANKVGGLVGYQASGSISGSHAHGTVSGFQDVGGLIGFSAGTPNVTTSHATGAVSGETFVGGLIGNKPGPGGSVDSCFATGSVTGTTDVVGGLIGFNGVAVTKSYAKTGAVTGQQRVGGLVGLNQKTIGISYAANNVSGTTYVGGLVGQSQEATALGLSDCYATGTVTGNDSVGGLVGRNEANNDVTRCYASGSVSGTTAVGGLIGDNIRTGNSSNYWNASTTGQPASGAGSIIGAIGLTSAQMKQQASFVGFNFASPWSITEGITEPLLSPVPASAAPTTTALNSSFNPSLPGQSVTFTATITGNAPSGTVLFQDGANPLPGCIAVVVAAAQAQCTRSDLALGTHPISAAYSGDALNTGSLSPTLNQMVVPPSLDVDSSVSQSKYDALTDGLLIVRYMSGLTGNALTNGALGSTAGRTSPVAIKSWLDGLGSMLDIDGNGSIDPATDGVLIVRYLFGQRGDALIAGAVDLALGTRKLAPDIEAWILMLLPP